MVDILPYVHATVISITRFFLPPKVFNMPPGKATVHVAKRDKSKYM